MENTAPPTLGARSVKLSTSADQFQHSTDSDNHHMTSETPLRANNTQGINDPSADAHARLPASQHWSSAEDYVNKGARPKVFKKFIHRPDDDNTRHSGGIESENISLRGVTDETSSRLDSKDTSKTILKLEPGYNTAYTAPCPKPYKSQCNVIRSPYQLQKFNISSVNVRPSYLNIDVNNSYNPSCRKLHISSGIGSLSKCRAKGTNDRVSAKSSCELDKSFKNDSTKPSTICDTYTYSNKKPESQVAKSDKPAHLPIQDFKLKLHCDTKLDIKLSNSQTEQSNLDNLKTLQQTCDKKMEEGINLSTLDARTKAQLLAERLRKKYKDNIDDVKRQSSSDPVTSRSKPHTDSSYDKLKKFHETKKRDKHRLRLNLPNTDPALTRWRVAGIALRKMLAETERITRAFGFVNNLNGRLLSCDNTDDDAPEHLTKKNKPDLISGIKKAKKNRVKNSNVHAEKTFDQKAKTLFKMNDKDPVDRGVNFDLLTEHEQKTPIIPNTDNIQIPWANNPKIKTDIRDQNHGHDTAKLLVLPVDETQSDPHTNLSYNLNRNNLSLESTGHNLRHQTRKEHEKYPHMFESTSDTESGNSLAVRRGKTLFDKHFLKKGRTYQCTYSPLVNKLDNNDNGIRRRHRSCDLYDSSTYRNDSSSFESCEEIYSPLVSSVLKKRKSLNEHVLRSGSLKSLRSRSVDTHYPLFTSAAFTKKESIKEHIFRSDMNKSSSSDSYNDHNIRKSSSLILKKSMNKDFPFQQQHPLKSSSSVSHDLTLLAIKTHQNFASTSSPPSSVMSPSDCYILSWLNNQGSSADDREHSSESAGINIGRSLSSHSSQLKQSIEKRSHQADKESQSTDSCAWQRSSHFTSNFTNPKLQSDQDTAVPNSNPSAIASHYKLATPGETHTPNITGANQSSDDTGSNRIDAATDRQADTVFVTTDQYGLDKSESDSSPASIYLDSETLRVSWPSTDSSIFNAHNEDENKVSNTKMDKKTYLLDGFGSSGGGSPSLSNTDPFHEYSVFYNSRIQRNKVIKNDNGARIPDDKSVADDDEEYDDYGVDDDADETSNDADDEYECDCPHCMYTGESCLSKSLFTGLHDSSDERTLNGVAAKTTTVDSDQSDNLQSSRDINEVTDNRTSPGRQVTLSVLDDLDMGDLDIDLNDLDLSVLDTLALDERSQRELVDVLIQFLILQMLSVIPDLLTDQAPPPASHVMIRRLPVVSASIDDAADEHHCAICLCHVVVGDRLTQLPCQHTFHPLCIESWLVKSATCPVCRQVLTDKETSL